MLKAHEDSIKKLFNTSGQDYRELKIKDKLATMTSQDAIELLSSNGNLIKRPFIIAEDFQTVGYKPEVWENFT
jgi:arsenate reductase